MVDILSAALATASLCIALLNLGMVIGFNRAQKGFSRTQR